MPIKLNPFITDENMLLSAGLDIYRWIEQQRGGNFYKINPGGSVDLAGGAVFAPYSLYSGSAGIGLLLLELYKATGGSSYIDEAKDVFNGLVSTVPDTEFYFEKYRTAPKSTLKIVGWHIGIYSGPVGAGIFALELYKILPDLQYLNFAERLADELLAASTSVGEGLYFSSDIDIFSDGGFILYFLALYEITGKQHYLTSAEKIGAYIISQAKHNKYGTFWEANDLSKAGFPKGSIYPGFSHGTAGIAYVLAALYEKSKLAVQLDTAIDAARFLEGIADEENGAALIPYIWNGGSDWQNKYYIGFCHGPAGTALLFRRLFRITNDRNWLDFAEKLSRGIIASGAPEHYSWGMWDSCRCCGTAGLVEHFLGMYNDTGKEEYISYAKRAAAKVISSSTQNDDGSRCFFGHWDRTAPRAIESFTGLYNGAAGAALALLKLYLFEHKRNQSASAET